ncbi:TauD/TfdA family dioxygenase [Plantactinospora sp. KLBMP9567]|uniref:TauD/TfdA family dioxygenase n=1 Tax=Plantactinospora sp. KLBMP9567 TaxID=3085900 RepID=UPI002981560D|nr:TauD/TfdA family dioxygenase [Plantactinospora sp. KLBMP9567]MDW5322359.1 TauD/TfdA family dioxygenase [Plantactinospora sp. KLBMP9567]
MSGNTAPPIGRLLLAPTDGAAVRALASRVVADLRYDPPVARLRQIALMSQELPLELRRALIDFRLSTDSGLVIGGLPIIDTDLGSSPPVTVQPTRHDELARADAMLLLIASFLGYPVSQAGVDEGRLVRDVSPLPGNETTQRGSGSSAELMWHNEDAYHPLRPDWICLLCLRNPDRTATSFARILDVPLDELTRSLLFQPLFRIEPDSSNVASETGNTPPAVAVLSGDTRRPFVRLDPAFMNCGPENGAAGDALAAAIKAVDRSLQDVPLAPGEIMIIDNLRSVHGRRPFTARYDGSDRWLRVVHATADLRRSEGFRTGDHGRAVLADVGLAHR